MKNTFKKEERLCSKILFDKAFASRKNINEFPLRIVWCYTQYETPTPCKSAFAVPKKRFKKAVDRNRIKRLLRESFRLNKHGLYTSLTNSNKQIALVMVFNSSEMPNFKLIEDKIILSLQRLKETIQKTD